MNMIRRLFFIILLGATIVTKASPFPANNDTLKLSLEEVIELLKTDNLHIQASEYEMSRAEETRRAQKGLYFPKVELGATFTQMSEPLELDLTPVRDAILPAYDLIGGQNALLQNLTDYMGATGTLDPATYQSFSEGINQLNQGRDAAVSAINNGEWVKTIQDEQFAVVDASVLMPLYTGGKIKAANKAAEAKLEISQAKNQQVVSQEITSVVERYFGLRLAMNVENVRKEVFAGMEKHLNDAIKMEENGMIARAERLHAEVALANAERELKKSQNMVELMQTALKNSLATNQPVKPTTDLFISPKSEKLQEILIVPVKLILQLCS
jgi:outer membrane protein TolC